MADIKNTIPADALISTGRGLRNMKDVIRKRNDRLKKLFISAGFEIHMIGDEQSPAIILNDKICLSCYVKNFDLILNNKPFDAEVMKIIKLTDVIHNDDKESLQNWVSDKQVQHRTIYRIEYGSTGLFLSGYNFLDKEDKATMYPVFAKQNPKVYFDAEYAQSICDKYEKFNYDLKII